MQKILPSRHGWKAWTKAGYASPSLLVGDNLESSVSWYQMDTVLRDMLPKPEGNHWLGEQDLIKSWCKSNLV